MLKLKEWEQVQTLAHVYAEELKVTYNIDVRVRPYTIYNGEKGIYLQLFDKYGCFYKQFATGTHNDINKYKTALKQVHTLIEREI